MSRLPAVNPYAPASQAGVVQSVGPTQYVIAGPAWTQIAIPDPARLYLLVAEQLPATGYTVSPSPIGGGQVGITVSDSGVVLIHAASYPGLCQGDWWVWCSGAATIYVWDSIVSI